MRKRKGLGVAPFCIPYGPSLSDNVTHREMQDELNRLRHAITLIVSRLGHNIGADDMREIYDLIRRPEDRA